MKPTTFATYRDGKEDVCANSKRKEKKKEEKKKHQYL
jgi:hypothetical protein